MVSVGLSARTALLLTIFCCPWITDSRKYSSELKVLNGGIRGEWGPASFCTSGCAVGFAQKVEKHQPAGDNTAVNGIRLHCNDGIEIESKVGPWGEWTANQMCRKGCLGSFSLKVHSYQGIFDDTSVNNIQFKCSDDADLRGIANENGKFGPWSRKCPSEGICGMRTRVEDAQGPFGDDTALNDVVFYCCQNSPDWEGIREVAETSSIASVSPSSLSSF
ncbi:vitelline membrane outer layer protein 1-like [Erythrolamprus reginae]|uniref:vitelline membrane outer layer protein 1-like n=1 Tax=Erythrolamprus reginae TaxID=121349 RepID=UPI00396C5A9C